jgi:cytochrome c oxidase subunit 2
MGTPLTWRDAPSEPRRFSTSNFAPTPASVIAVTDPSTGPTGTSDPSRSRVRGVRRRWVSALIIGAPLLLAGCNWYPSYGADPGVTRQGHDTFKLYSAMTTVGIIVGGAVMLLIIWTVLRYRKRSDEIPKQFHENGPIEVLYTVVPILIVAVLFVFTVITENSVDATQPANATLSSSGPSSGEPVVNITVTAFQWGWRFDYTGLNVGVVGELTNGPNNHGPQMVVPVGETLQITLVSNDTIHGFYLRDFNFSRYAQPGVTNIFDFNLLRTGTFDGQCTQFCGLYHSEMLFSIRSVSPADFETWASAEVAAGHTLQNSASGAENNPPPNTRITSTPPPNSVSSAAPSATTNTKAPA